MNLYLLFGFVSKELRRKLSEVWLIFTTLPSLGFLSSWQGLLTGKMIVQSEKMVNWKLLLQHRLSSITTEREMKHCWVFGNPNVGRWRASEDALLMHPLHSHTFSLWATRRVWREGLLGPRLKIRMRGRRYRLTCSLHQVYPELS